MISSQSRLEQGDAATPASCLVVAIPANNEAERIEACLSALAMQRDRHGAPLTDGSFEVLLLANNCTDATAEAARMMACVLPYRLHVVEEVLGPHESNAGCARKRAMDLAATRLDELEATRGAILTTDSDSRVGSTWIAATRETLARGADCVAGYIDADPVEIVRLGAAFLARGRLEDRYLRLMAEIDARCDPRAHDPWPNHRVSSGASLAVTLAAYRAIGGLPPLALGEDAALTRSLEVAGFHVRHSLDVCVTTSCRLDGRAKGGAAETMRFRHEHQDAPCDGDLEPALPATRRALIKGILRRLRSDPGRWQRLASILDLSLEMLVGLAQHHSDQAFEGFWRAVEAASPVLRAGSSLRPSDLPGQIARAEGIVRTLRRRSVAPPFPRPIALPGALGAGESAPSIESAQHAWDPQSEQLLREMNHETAVPHAKTAPSDNVFG